MSSLSVGTVMFSSVAGALFGHYYLYPRIRPERYIDRDLAEAAALHAAIQEKKAQEMKAQQSCLTDVNVTGEMIINDLQKLNANVTTLSAQIEELKRNSLKNQE